MSTEHSYNRLSDRVYWLDPKHDKYDPTMKPGAIRKLAGIEYEILNIETNSNNGMQAMAVAPIVNGKPDTSQVVIAYVQTNSPISYDRCDLFQVILWAIAN